VNLSLCLCVRAHFCDVICCHRCKQGLSYGIAIKGTHAHSFVSSFVGFKDLKKTTMKDAHGVEREFAAVAQKYRAECGFPTNEGELAAFVSYALAYPSGFLALVDTYDTLNSGVPNFLCVALALHEVPAFGGWHGETLASDFVCTLMLGWSRIMLMHMSQCMRGSAHRRFGFFCVF
jgi:hypothetical protein